MANDLNQCQFIGRLGNDPEIRYTPAGKAVANISLACGEKWKDQGGQAQEKTEWIRVVIFGKLAEVAGQYLKKGSQVYVSGKMQTRKWQNQQDQDQYTTEIVLDPFNGVMQMLGGKQNEQSQPAQQNRPQQGAPNQPASKPMAEPDFDFDDDPPF